MKTQEKECLLRTTETKESTTHDASNEKLREINISANSKSKNRDLSESARLHFIGIAVASMGLAVLIMAFYRLDTIPQTLPKYTTFKQAVPDILLPSVQQVAVISENVECSLDGKETFASGYPFGKAVLEVFRCFLFNIKDRYINAYSGLLHQNLDLKQLIKNSQMKHNYGHASKPLWLRQNIASSFVIFPENSFNSDDIRNNYGFHFAENTIYQDHKINSRLKKLSGSNRTILKEITKTFEDEEQQAGKLFTNDEINNDTIWFEWDSVRKVYLLYNNKEESMNLIMEAFEMILEIINKTFDTSPTFVNSLMMTIPLELYRLQCATQGYDRKKRAILDFFIQKSDYSSIQNGSASLYDEHLDNPVKVIMDKVTPFIIWRKDSPKSHTLTIFNLVHTEKIFSRKHPDVGKISCGTYTSKKYVTQAVGGIFVEKTGKNDGNEQFKFFTALSAFSVGGTVRTTDTFLNILIQMKIYGVPFEKAVNMKNNYYFNINTGEIICNTENYQEYFKLYGIRCHPESEHEETDYYTSYLISKTENSISGKIDRAPPHDSFVGY